MSGRLPGTIFGLAAGAVLAASPGEASDPPPITAAPPLQHQIVDWSEFLGHWAAVQEVGALVSAQKSAATSCSGPATLHLKLCSVVKSDAPLITPATDPLIGKNIAMPSVVKAPSWLPNRLGNYYMYFAAHNGRYIRLAYADSPIGPWTIYSPGSLRDADVAPFSKTISSPDVFVSNNPDRIRMYFSTDVYAGSAQQWSGVAQSADGINFTLASTENIAKYYLRVWPWMGKYYGVFKGWSTAPAELAVSPDGIQRFLTQQIFTAHGSIRHMAVLIKDDIALIFYSKIGEAPERILLSTMKMSGPAASWQLSAPIEVLRPTLAYEGANHAIRASEKGPATNVNQVRDPYILEDGGKTYLYYSIAGESGIAVAELTYQILAGSSTPPPPPPGTR
jgi:hypothetical protein